MKKLNLLCLAALCALPLSSAACGDAGEPPFDEEPTENPQTNAASSTGSSTSGSGGSAAASTVAAASSTGVGGATSSTSSASTVSSVSTAASTTVASSSASGGSMDSAWGSVCTSDGQCMGPTDYCVKQPGKTEGYCTIKCKSTSVCQGAGATQGWTCNAISCFIPSLTWCGPSSEIGQGPVKECK